MARILLVEDDDDLVATLRDVLMDEGHEVLSARSGQEALAAAGAGITLGFIDLHIEGAPTGGELLTRLRALLPAGSRLYLLSGEPDLPARARELGADGCLEKPFGIDRLLSLLDEATRPPAAP